MAVSLDGTNDYLNIGTMGNFGSGLNVGYSVSAWVKLDGTGTQDCLCGQVNTGPSIFTDVLLNSSGNAQDSNKIRAQVRNAGGEVCNGYTTNDTIIGDGNWHHLLATVAPGAVPVVQIIVDGVAQDISYQQRDNVNDNWANLDYAMTVGTWNLRSVSTYPFDGLIADFAIWLNIKTVADAAEIYARKRIPLRMFDSNIQVYLPLMGPTGAALATTDWGCKDLSGKGNSVAAEVGASVWADDPLAPQSWVERSFGGAWVAAAVAAGYGSVIGSSVVVPGPGPGVIGSNVIVPRRGVA